MASIDVALKAGACASRCWKAPSAAGVVMFHGWHRHSFIAHAHEAITVIQVTAGAVEIEVDSIAHPVRAGQLVLIGANQVHAARPLDREGWAMRSLHLPPAFFQGLGEPAAAEAIRFARPVYQGPAADHGAYADWHRACEYGATAQATESYHLFTQWLQRALPSFEPRVGEKEDLDDRIAQARAILLASVFENDNLDAIAARVGLSSFTLIRRFTREFGLSPHVWRMQERTRAAARLIRAHENLAEVAWSCGFTDQSHLARVFKRVYGVTPGQYRSIH